MTRTVAVKSFLEKDSSRPITNTEFMAFWKVCTDTERQEFAVSAARQLGVELTEK